ncbi:hypothetical protein, partial [Mesotoga sp. Brook.08.105.5.1]
GLGLIRGKLKETSETMIAFTMIAMNLARWLRGFFFHFSDGYSGKKSEQFRGCSTSKSTYCESTTTLLNMTTSLTGTR